MKKNVLMRAASGLLVATMLTTCAISGTFAKYVTQDNGGDVARVAKWGVIVQVEGDLYGENYLDKPVNTATDESEDKASVSSKLNGAIGGTANLVAPGTKSDDTPYSFSINGTPEVDSQTTIKITAQNIYLKAGTYGVMVPVQKNVVTPTNYSELYKKLYTVDAQGVYTAAGDTYNDVDYYTLEDVVTSTKDYYPVVYQMNGVDENTDSTFTDTKNDGPDNKENDTLLTVSNAILNQVKNGVGQLDTTADPAVATAGSVTDWSPDEDGKYTATATSAVIKHNQDLESVFKLANQTITWAWEFEDKTSDFGKLEDSSDPAYLITEQDKLDTILGNLMAERDADFGSVESGTVNIDGTVVKLDVDNYKSPVVTTDYCLDTCFNIDILVEQVD